MCNYASGALEWRMGTERMVDDAPVAFQTRGGIQTAIATVTVWST